MKGQTCNTPSAVLCLSISTEWHAIDNDNANQASKAMMKEYEASTDLICQLERVMGVELGKGGSHVHLGEGLAHAVARAVTEGEPALALLAHVQPQVIHLLAVAGLLLLACREEPRLLCVLSTRLPHPLFISASHISLQIQNMAHSPKKIAKKRYVRHKA